MTEQAVDAEAQDAYQRGRRVAAVLGGTGWVLVAAGVAFASAGLVMPATHPMPFAVKLIGTLPGLGVALFGLALVLFVDIARAVFDNAAAVRALAPALPQSRGQARVPGAVRQ